MKTRIFSLFLLLLWPIGLNTDLDDTLLTWLSPSETAPAEAALSGPEAFLDLSQVANITAGHQGTAGYPAAGQAWGDYNNDGWADLYVTGNEAENVLYVNNGHGIFVVPRTSLSVSLPEAKSGGAVWADFDNDGWRDLYVLNDGANALFHNEDGIQFKDISTTAGLADDGKAMAAAWGDYDGDGFLDLYLANGSCAPACNPIDPSLAQDRLYRNNGDGSFRDVSRSLVFQKLLGSAAAAAFLDYDNDGDLDIYVVNDQANNPIGNVLWRNDGQGCGGWCWTDSAANAGVDQVLNGGGLAIADYDHDQDLDIVVANQAMLQNQGDGSFSDAAATAQTTATGGEMTAWGAAVIDYDNDGRPDLLLSTSQAGDIGSEAANLLYANNGDGSFSNITPTSWETLPKASVSAATADYDRDGRLDFAAGIWNSGQRLYHNEGIVGGDNHWLAVKLVGGGPVNRDAVGARVLVTDSDGRTHMQAVTSQTSVAGGHDSLLHFGLGQAQIDQVTVIWPNGFENQFDDVAVDQIWEIGYPAGSLGRIQNRSGFILALVLAVVLAMLIANWKKFIRFDFGAE